MSEETKSNKEYWLSSLSINNSTSVFIITFMLVVFGLYAYMSMPKEQFPEIVMPTIYVNTIYPGNSPVDIENLVTRPLEKQIKSVKGIKKLTSTSAQDISAVLVEFNEDVNVQKAVQDVKDAVDKAKKDLPNDLQEDPRVTELDLSEVPIVVINLSGDFDLEKLKEYAEYLSDEIEELPEVSKVEMTGAMDREIQINCDLYEMEARKISFSDIENAIKSENMAMSGGDVLTSGYRRSLRIDGEFKSIQELEDMIVKSENGVTIYLKDVADVKDSYVERNSYARLATENFIKEGSHPVVSLKVVKKSGENLINASDKIDELLAKAKKEKFPATLAIIMTDSQSDNMKNQLSNLENSIISGVILVIAVLLFFMGLRNALFVGLAIPLSMFMSFMVLSAMGVTINMVVLFGLILALGMLVDNAIVIIENILRMREEGKSALQAAKDGAGEVAVPIISSTATTLAAFVPLAFWGGLMGEFMKYLPITLIVVLSSSLFIGLVINPVVAFKYMSVKKNHEKTDKKPLTIFGLIVLLLSIVMYVFAFSKPDSEAVNYTNANIMMTIAVMTLGNVYMLRPMADWFQNVFLTWLERFYKAVLYYALAGWKPYFFLAGTFVTLVLSIKLMSVSVPQVILFPENDPLYAYLYVEAPLGTDVETSNKLTEQVEKKVFETLAPYQKVVSSVVTNIGKGTGNPQAGNSAQVMPHKARISVGFVQYEFRGDISTAEIINKLRDAVKGIAGVTIITEKNQSGPPTGKPINIEVVGIEYEKLIIEAEKIKAKIDAAGIAGIEGMKLEVELGKPELTMNIDRDKARKFEVSTAMLAMNMRTAIFGKEVSKFKDGEDDYPIQLRLADQYRYDVSALTDQKLTFRDNRGKFHQVPISAIAEVSYNSTYGSVKRKDLDKMIAVSSNIAEGANGNEIVSEIKALLAEHQMPEGYSYKFTGQQEEQAKSMAFLSKALLIALFSIFLILVSQFNSLSKPFIIVGSVLFSTIGVFLGISIMGDDFVIIMTGIGIISLAGIVVNNAIVLIDYTDVVMNRKREEQGLEKDAKLSNEDMIESLVEAGYTRLRPVLLTAITTVLGLIPLAMGLNIDFINLYKSFDPKIYWGGENAMMWGPMAWTVIYGLTFATFLTLVIVPAMFLLTEKLKGALKGIGKKKPKEMAEA